MEEKVDVKKFISEYLIKGIGQLIDKEFHYFAFILISEGIEFLGSLFDDKPFDEHIPKGGRFKKALEKNLFPNSFYKQNQDWLYDNLRCSLIHQIRPNNKVLLTSNSLNKYPKEKHLKKLEGSDQRIIIVELFYQDFKKACEKILNMIDKNNQHLNQNKINENYINIFSIDIDGIDYQVTGGTQYNLVVYKKPTL